jgi:hypothetical protein
MSAGFAHTCALDENKTAWCWGERIGQLIPQEVPGGHRFKAISLWYETACALDVDGRAYCWGRDPLTGANRTSPQLVASTPPLTKIAPGYHGICGITSGGSLYCWGPDRGGILVTRPGILFENTTPLEMPFP